MSPHFFIVAGEPSGDAHAARLMQALRAVFPACRFSGIGGVAMQREGLQSLVSLEEISVVGFWEVAKKYPMFRALLQKCASHLASDDIDMFIPVDYPGFNLRLARAAKQANVRVVWYIAPQLWAWGEHRARDLRNAVDMLLTVFPFEEDFFRQHGINTRFVGHPLADNTEILASLLHPSERLTNTGLQEIALVPGSRQQEIERHWSIMLNTASILYSTHTNLTFTLAAAPNLAPETISTMTHQAQQCNIPLAVETNSHALFRRAEVGIVKAGTSTLEAALCGMPYTMMYRTSHLSYLLAKRAITLPYIALPNILLHKECGKPAVVREFIQHAATPQALAAETMRLLDDDAAYRECMIAGFAEVRDILGVRGIQDIASQESASMRAAKEIAAYF